MVIPYYIVVNIIAFAMYGADKYFAKNDMWRISEKALLGIAAIGGAFGAFLGMETFRHKTKHPRFSVGLPLIFIAQSVLILLFLKVTL